MAELPPIVLVFAASDPSGGAGLQADIMTLSSMGCHPLSVVTAVTIQDTTGVDAVSPLDAGWVGDRRCGERRAGVPLADTQGGIQARHGPAYSRPLVLGARRRGRGR